MALRKYSSTAVPTSLTSLVNSATPGDTDTLNVATTTGFPSVPFTIGVDRGTADEEAMLVTAVTATTMTVERGYDGTDAVGHLNGASVEHCVLRKDYEEANAHIWDDARDDHSQYLNLTRLGLYSPKGFDGSSPFALSSITTTYQTANLLTIPSATFDRLVKATALIPWLGPDSAIFRGRLLLNATVIGSSYMTGLSLASMPLESDWVALPSGSTYQIRSQIKRDSGAGGWTDDDPLYNKISALVVPDI